LEGGRVANQEPKRDHTAEGGWYRSEHEPLDEVQIDVSLAQVHRAAKRLHERCNHEVIRHGGKRLHAEEQDEHRCHQRAAAHAGHADDHPDDRSTGSQRPIHKTPR
jgi:hypothetical protein